jgi:hypothetical protein
LRIRSSIARAGTILWSECSCSSTPRRYRSRIEAMTGTELAAVGDLLREVVACVRENGSMLPDDEVLASLSVTRELMRLVTQIQVEAVAELQRRGTFTATATDPRPRSRRC